jgi:hypothetical protein
VLLLAAVHLLVMAIVEVFVAAAVAVVAVVTAHEGSRLGCWVMVVARSARALIYFFGRLSLWFAYLFGPLILWDICVG